MPPSLSAPYAAAACSSIPMSSESNAFPASNCMLSYQGQLVPSYAGGCCATAQHGTQLIALSPPTHIVPSPLKYRQCSFCCLWRQQLWERPMNLRMPPHAHPDIIRSLLFCAANPYFLEYRGSRTVTTYHSVDQPSDEYLYAVYPQRQQAAASARGANERPARCAGPQRFPGVAQRTTQPEL